MSINMGTYVPRQSSVRAVRVTRDNIKSVAKMLDCKVQRSKYGSNRPYLVARPAGEATIVYLGEWVLYDDDKGHRFLENEEFVGKYEETE